MSSIIVGITALFIAFISPAILLQPAEAVEEPARLLVVESQPEAEETIIRLQTGKGVENLDLNTYLTGVLLAEMPMSFEIEALKAQAVAARTFTLRQFQGGKHESADICDQSECCQAWIGQEGLSDKLGDCWKNYWERATHAVEATADLVMTYEGELINAVYFSCSGGATEDAVAVWGGAVPYLVSVESPGEENASKYQTEVSVTREAFCRIILQAQPLADLSGPMEHWVGSVERSKGGGVAEMVIGGVTFTGTELRTLFGLNATNFTLQPENGEMVFEVFGYGHRVGMSQYGANAMAQGGKSFREILAHYYQGVKIERSSK